MKLELLDFIELDNYPTGSGIEFYDDRIYLIGGDAQDLLVMSKKWSKPDLIALSPADKKGNTPEPVDLEAMTVLSVDKKPHLLIIGAGNTNKKDKALLVNLKNNAIKPVDLTVFYNRIRAAGISNLNIEGIAEVYDYLVLVHRGNSSNPQNHLIITTADFWKNQEKANLQTIVIDFENVGLKPGKLGVSGLTYSDKHEDLFITISTENDDANSESGKSYLAVIENLYRKIGREKGKIKINQLIDLSETDERFKGYKMESVAIQSEKDHSIKLQLVADNDKGKTYLFKVSLGW